MADVKISQLPAATTPVVGTEILPIVQSGVTSRVTINAATGITRPFTANGVMYASSATALATGSSFVFDGSNLGLGVTPSAWASGNKFIDVNASASYGAFGSSDSMMLANAYWNGSNWIRKNANNAWRMAMEASSGAPSWTFQYAGNSTAGSTISWSEAMRIDSSGNVGIGTSSPGAKLDVSGTAVQFNNTAGAFDLKLYNTARYDGRITVNSTGLEISQRQALPMLFLTSDTERMRIAANGIVTMSAYGVGTATFSAAGVISSVSDETWKTKDGVPVDTDAMLKKLEPGYWYYNDEKKNIFGADRQLGFYAQNVNAAIGPEAAPEPEEGKPWGYYDRSVLAVVVMSLQKALSTIESLETRIAALEAK